MARVYPRNGWYYADYTDANGDRQRPSLDTQNYRVALMKLAQLVGDAEAGRLPNPGKNKLWRLCVDRYLNWVKREQDPKTYRADALAFKRYEEMYHPETMSEVTPDTVNEFKWQMEKDGVGVYARERAIRAIKASMPRLEEAEGLPLQNWHRVKNVKLPKPGRTIWFTHEEMQRILKACRKPHWKTIVLLGARAGLRAGEIYSLLWENVLWDFGDYGAVDICHKADWSPKCGKPRIVPITKELREHLLQEHKRSRSPWVVAEGEWRPSGIDSLGHVFHKILRAIGLKGMMHKLRHTYGSDLARLGKSEKQIMELMGHSTSRSVQIYMHLQPKDVVSVVNDLKPYGK